MKFLKYLINPINGLCMAIANSVPGVSGGTIALLMGFYDDFIGAFNDIIYHKGKRLHGLFYVLTLGIGWGVGMVSAVFLLDAVFEEHIYAVSSLFFGFVLCSIPVMVWDERKCLKLKWKYSFIAVLGAVLIAVITYFSVKSITNHDMSSFSIGFGILLCFVGAFAIVAMLLPGISGSTIFLVFGLYRPIIAGLKKLMSFDVAVLPSFLFLGIGAVVGGLLAVKGIKYCLERFRGQTIYASLGMLIGSLYSIMMGPKTLDSPKEWMAPTRFNWIFFVIGAALVALLQLLKIIKHRKLVANTGNDASADN